MTIVRTFNEYVRRRLDGWGREFALSNDFEMLGHKSKDILQVLIDHRGEMPARSVGFKPLSIPPEPMQIEDIVRGIHHETPTVAVVLRAYYCGHGRQSFERKEIAELILGRAIRRKAYFDMHARGFDRVAAELLREVG